MNIKELKKELQKIQKNRERICNMTEEEYLFECITKIQRFIYTNCKYDLMSITEIREYLEAVKKKGKDYLLILDKTTNKYLEIKLDKNSDKLYYENICHLWL